MTHEPDCPLSQINSEVDPADCALCPVARAAYRRGREDEQAEKPPVVLSFRRPITDKQYRRIVAAIAAARGDAPCAHTRTQYTREVCWCGDAVDVCEDCGIDVHECGTDRTARSE